MYIHISVLVVSQLYRVLGTPNNAVWPGVTELPDFKPSFPRWAPRPVSQICPKLSTEGRNLLMVITHTHYTPTLPCRSPPSLTLINSAANANLQSWQAGVGKGCPEAPILQRFGQVKPPCLQSLRILHALHIYMYMYTTIHPCEQMSLSK